MAKHVIVPGSAEPMPESGVITPAPPGADLSALDASNLTSGTIPLARIVGLTDAQIAAGAAIAWTKVSKAGSSLADLATRSAADLSSGVLALARLANIADAQIDAAAAIAWSKISKAGSSLADLATRSAADLTSGRIAPARVWTSFDCATTGNIDDLDFLDANQIRMTNATLATIRGLKAGVAGQEVTIVSLGAGEVDLSHQDAGDATAASRLINFETVGKTALAAGVGAAHYQYDATTARWRLTSHELGLPLGCALTNSTTFPLPDSVDVIPTFDTETFDSGGLHSTSSNTSRITVPVGGAGIYQIVGQARFTPNATNSRFLQVDLNGASTGIFFQQSVNSAAVASVIQVSGILKLSEGDYIELEAGQNSGVALTLTNVYFAATRVPR